MFTRNRLYGLVLGLSMAGYSWLAFNLFNKTAIIYSPCLIKNATGIPCPSCGTTRSLAALMCGDFSGALYWNPIGLLLAVAAVIFPAWILMDFWRNKNSFWLAFQRTERLFQQPLIAYPAIVLIIANWIWNIFKGL